MMKTVDMNSSRQLANLFAFPLTCFAFPFELVNSHILHIERDLFPG